MTALGIPQWFRRQINRFPIVEMSEGLAGADGPATTSAGFDLVAIGQALSLSSTSVRIAQLHHVDDAIRRKGS